jgi:ferredoxin
MSLSQKKQRFIIYDHCIACTTCQQMARPMFEINATGTMAVIIQQPQTPLEVKKSMQALKSCPVSAIGVRSE